MARLSDTQLAEMRRLHAQTDALLDALAMVEPDFATIASDFKTGLRDAALAQNARQVRMLSQDLRALMAAVPLSRRAEVLAHVRRVSGFPLEDEQRQDATLVAGIIGRREVRNDNEYYLLRNYLTWLEADPGTSPPEMATIHALLDNYLAPPQ